VATTTIQFEHPVETWFDGQYSLIPERMREALKRYVIDRIAPGSFLTRIIQNDLKGAFDYADDENIKLIGLYLLWLENFPPARSWGSPSAMAKWLKES
jgi:hypothetical protein